MVVWPARTLFQPSVRRVRIPPSMALCAMVMAGARFKISGRNGLVEDQQFVNAHAALVTQLPACFAPRAVPEFGRANFVLGKADPAQIIALHLLLGFAVRTNGAHEALGHAPLPPRRPPGTVRSPCRSSRVKALGASLVCRVLKTK